MFGNVADLVPTSKGPCIFGQGYCSPNINNVTQTFNKNLNETINQNLMQYATSVNAVMTVNQDSSVTGVQVVNCTGPVSITSGSNTAKVTFDFSRIANTMNEIKYNNLMTNAVSSALDATNKATNGALSAGNAANVLNLNQTANETISRLVNSYSLSDFNNLMAQMTVNQKSTISNVVIDGGGGSCTVASGNNAAELTFTASVISNAVSTSLAKMIQEANVASTTKADNSVTSTGLIQDLGNAISSIFTSIGDIFTGPFKYIILIIGLFILVSVIGAIISRSKPAPVATPAPAPVSVKTE